MTDLWSALPPVASHHQQRSAPLTSERLSSRLPWLPPAADLVTLAVLGVALLVLLGPTYLRLAQTVWAGDEQSHGPIVLALAAWLIFRRRHALAALPPPQRTDVGWAVLVAGMVCLAFGRSQSLAVLEVGSQLLVVSGLLLLFRGPSGLRLCAFPVLFLLFTVPLPSVLVATLTAPLKLAVSAAATELLHAVGYPIARQGVVLSVGPYQLLVADACAGLNSIFMLEALVLLYMNLMGYRQRVRNVFLVLAALPISFVANIVRVMVLVLVTYHFGDAAGQGFVHDFAGVLLLLVALFLTGVVDRAFGALSARRAPS